MGAHQQSVSHTLLHPPTKTRQHSFLHAGCLRRAKHDRACKAAARGGSLLLSSHGGHRGSAGGRSARGLLDMAQRQVLLQGASGGDQMHGALLEAQHGKPACRKGTHKMRAGALT